LENVYPVRKTLQTIKTMGIQVINIMGSGLWIIKTKTITKCK